MKRTILAIALAFSITPALAADWIFLTTTRDRSHVYEVRAGSGGLNTTVDGVAVYEVTLRIRKGYERFTFERNYVTLNDCANGQGTLVAASMNGFVLYTNDFVFGGRSIASGIAEGICKLAGTSL